MANSEQPKPKPKPEPEPEPKPKPNTTLSAPVGSIDLAAFWDDGTAYEIYACDSCLPWHAEVVQVDGEILVREWHAVDCWEFQKLLDGE